MVGKGLEERLELQVRSEGVHWPLCGEFLQVVSNGFGGHHGVRPAEFQISGMETRPSARETNIPRPVHFGTFVPSLRCPPPWDEGKKRSGAKTGLVVRENLLISSQGLTLHHNQECSLVG